MTSGMPLQVSISDRAAAIDSLLLNPGANAWALQDLKFWPERARLHYLPETLGRADFTYLLVTGHPGAQRHRTIILAGDPRRAGSLLGLLPDGPWVVRESPASMLGLLAERFPAAKVWHEQRMQVDRDSFRAPQPIGTVRRLEEKDLPALAAMTGTPPPAHAGLLQWINGAHLYGAWSEGQLAATASTFVTVPEVWELIGVETDAKFRRQGFGRQVTGMLTGVALRQSPIVTLTVLTDNDPAKRMYAGLGFRTCEDRIWLDNGTGSAPG
jgi:GNAT superfamily N-acetyltransferase